MNDLKYDKWYIWNFCIIAHVDHGKSTLADWLIEYTNAVPKFKMEHRFLDSLNLEKKRGITIKSSAITLKYHLHNDTYHLNLIDTPGHIDFSLEVDRSLNASDGAILLIDGSKGVESQTILYAKKAWWYNVPLIYAINKIDLPTTNIQRTIEQLWRLESFDEDWIVYVSGKKGIGIKDLILHIIKYLPNAYKHSKDECIYVFDSFYDWFIGLNIVVRNIKGTINSSTFFFIQGKVYQPFSLHTLNFNKSKVDKIHEGMIGLIRFKISNIMKLSGRYIWFNICKKKLSNAPSCSISKIIDNDQKNVFCSIFPEYHKDFLWLKRSIKTLNIIDPAFSIEGISNSLYGMGYCIGAQGLLHLDILLTTLLDTYKVWLICTSPWVIYKIKIDQNKYKLIYKNEDFPNVNDNDILEPFCKAKISIWLIDVGRIKSYIIQEKWSIIIKEEIEDEQYHIYFDIPLSEIIFNFYDRIKSLTSGHAIFTYKIHDFWLSKVQKINIIIHGEWMNGLSFIIHPNKWFKFAKKVLKIIKMYIPWRLFSFKIQACIHNKVIASETIKAFWKDVTSKCYGGDQSWKDKLLRRQKEGKKLLKKGKINIKFSTLKQIYKKI